VDDPDLFRTKSVAEGVRSRASKSDPRPLQKVEDPLLKFVASQVVSARQKLGITQDQLAEKAGCAPLTAGVRIVSLFASASRGVRQLTKSLCVADLQFLFRATGPRIEGGGSLYHF
jgi:hypothetical protein